MKKILLSFFAIFILFFPVFSQTVDSHEDVSEQESVSLNFENLYGIWEGKDRFVFIEPREEENKPVEIVILLKGFYGWYYDRVAEPEKYSEAHPRTRNSATPRNAEHVTLEIQSVNKSTLENTYELMINYSKRQQTAVPVVIIDNNMFIDFYVQDKDDKNFYRGVAKSKGITASEQSVNKNLTSYYVDNDNIYNIRYWITDMPFTDSKADLKHGENIYKVDTHVLSGGKNYTCVAGRRKTVRNPYEPEKLTDKYYFTEDKSIMLTDTAPYLTKLADKNTFDQLVEIVKKANSRKRPEPDPLFPDMKVDFHWDIIDMLEKDVTLIQEVRARQKAFGPRGKDINK